MTRIYNAGNDLVNKPWRHTVEMYVSDIMA